MLLTVSHYQRVDHLPSKNQQGVFHLRLIFSALAQHLLFSFFQVNWTEKSSGNQWWLGRWLVKNGGIFQQSMRNAYHLVMTNIAMERSTMFNR